jgi:prepilin-type N-terminal cleavage/methylation domain-containing protein
MAGMCIVGTERDRSTAQAGFTVVELLMVIAIIGILSATALHNVTKHAHKARRAEAFKALHTLSIAQSAYFAENGGYADTFDEIGFLIPGGVRLDSRTLQAPHYTYTLAALELGGNPRGNYRATAVGDIDPTDPVLDIVIIENQIVVNSS